MAAFSIVGLHCDSAFAGPLGQAPDDDISLVRVGVVLLLCLMLAVAGGFVLKARSGGALFSGRTALLELFAARKIRRLQLVESLRLGHQTDLSIVRCDGRELLVLTSPQRAELLDRLPPGALSEPKEQ